MLTFLSIENFALIQRLELEFQQGLNLITGETGSGKSILVDAVGLVVGERASQEMVRQGFEKARVEAIFSLQAGHPARLVLEEAEIPLEGNEIMVRREISRSGANKIFINNCLSTLGLLSRLGRCLADIHGQHDQQGLLAPSVQLAFLDAFLGDDQLLKQLSQLFLQLSSTQEKRRELEADEQLRLQRLDMLRFQIEEIEKLQLRPGLDVQLEEERQLLATAERRSQSTRQAYQLLYEKEDSSLGLLQRAEKGLEELAGLDPQCRVVVERLSGLRYELEEIAYELRDYASRIEVNPAQLEKLEERLGEIQRVRRKYGDTVEEMLGYLEKIQQEFRELSQYEFRIGELTEEEAQLQEQYQASALRLSSKRQRRARELSRKVERELADLNMAGAVFTVKVDPQPGEFTERGLDRVEFYISTNVGEGPKPLAQIASGGELSRAVLALKSILTLEEYSKTLVFDEVDSGIGGVVASRIGERLARLAKRHQVFCVTHLPQIACHAAQHFRVDKQERGKRTVVEVEALDKTARVRELARMMAGSTLTETTRRHARELLEQAQQGTP